MPNIYLPYKNWKFCFDNIGLDLRTKRCKNCPYLKACEEKRFEHEVLNFQEKRGID